MKASLLFPSLVLACAALAAPTLWAEQNPPHPAAAASGAQAASAEMPSIEAIARFAAAGDPVAQNNLGFYYAFGKNVPQNYQEALKWLTASASKGFAPAEVNLAVLYEKGWAGKVDLARAARWYLAAAEQGEPTAQSKLGNLYRSGRGVARDDVAAAEWFRKAAEQGNAAAENNLGAMYHHGIRASRATMPWRSSGTGKPRIRGLWKRRAIWA
jgi:TPR repeat protein